MNVYDLGDLVRVKGTFREAENSELLDPEVVKLSVKTPAGVTTTYVYGTDVLVDRQSTGIYRADIDADEVGVWYYRWWSTGTGQAADEGSFEIEAVQAV